MTALPQDTMRSLVMKRLETGWCFHLRFCPDPLLGKTAAQLTEHFWKGFNHRLGRTSGEFRIQKGDVFVY